MIVSEEIAQVVDDQGNPRIITDYSRFLTFRSLHLSSPDFAPI